MSFPKSKTIRFNDATGCAPPVGSYDPNFDESKKGPFSFLKSDRFKEPKEMSNNSSNSNSLALLTPKKLFNTSHSSTDNSRSAKKPSRSTILDNSKVNSLEKEVKNLIHERSKLLKEVSQKEEEYNKIDSKLHIASREKTYLNANIASLVKELKTLRKGNALLKAKLSSLENNGVKRNEFAKELGQLKESMVNKSHEVDELNEGLKSAQTKLSDKVRECLEKEDEIVVAQTKWQNAREEIDTAEDAISVLESKNSNLDEEIQDLCEELNLMEVRVRELQDFNDKLQKDRQEYTCDMENIRGRHATEVHDFLTRMSELDEENKRLKCDNDEFVLRNNLSVQEREVLKQDKACVVTLQEYKNSLEKRIQVQKGSIAELKDEQDKNGRLVRKLQDDVTVLQKAIDDKEQLLFETNAEKAQLVEEMSALKSNEEILRESIMTVSANCAAVEDMLTFERKTNKEREDELESQLELTKTSLEDVNEELKQVNGTNVALLSQLNSEKSLSELKILEANQLKEELESQRQALDGKTSDFNDLWGISKQKDRDLEELHMQKELCCEEMNCLKEEFSETQLKLSDVLRELTLFKVALSEKEKLLDDLTEENNLISTNMQNADQEKMQVLDGLFKLSEKFVRFEEFSGDAKHSSSCMRAEDLLARLGDKMAAVNGENSTLQKEVEAFEEKCKEYEAQITLLKDNVEENTSTVNSLKDMQVEENTEMLTLMKSLGEDNSDFLEECQEKFNGELSLMQLDSDGIHKEFEILKSLLKDYAANEQLLKEEITSLRSPHGDGEIVDLKAKVECVEGEIHDKEILHRNEVTAMENEHSKKIRELERKIVVLVENSTRNKEDDKWKTLYEDLNEKILPFKEQIDAFLVEKDQLLSQNIETKHDLVSLSEKYANLLGHPNQKQKIKHVIKLKQDNLNLKHELDKVKELCTRQQQRLSNLSEKFVTGDIRRKSSVRLADKENFPKPLQQSQNINRSAVSAKKANSYNDLSSRKMAEQQNPRIATNYGLL